LVGKIKINWGRFKSFLYISFGNIFFPIYGKGGTRALNSLARLGKNDYGGKFIRTGQFLGKWPGVGYSREETWVLGIIFKPPVKQKGFSL